MRTSSATSSSLERSHYDVAFHLLAVRNTTKLFRLYFNQTGDATHWEILSNCKHAWSTMVVGRVKRELSNVFAGTNS